MLVTYYNRETRANVAHAQGSVSVTVLECLRRLGFEFGSPDHKSDSLATKVEALSGGLFWKLSSNEEFLALIQPICRYIPED